MAYTYILSSKGHLSLVMRENMHRIFLVSNTTVILVYSIYKVYTLYIVYIQYIVSLYNPLVIFVYRYSSINKLKLVSCKLYHSELFDKISRTNKEIIHRQKVRKIIVVYIGFIFSILWHKTLRSESPAYKALALYVVNFGLIFGQHKFIETSRIYARTHIQE